MNTRDIDYVRKTIMRLNPMFKVPFPVDVEVESVDQENDLLRINEWYIQEKADGFELSVEVWSPGSRWEPPEADIQSLGTTKTLRDAVLLMVTETIQNCLQGAEQADAEVQALADAERYWSEAACAPSRQ